MSNEETHFDKESLNTVQRYKHRAAYDRKTIYSIARAAPVLHVAFICDEGLPQCIPMVGALEEIEDGEAFVYLHGSSVSRFIKSNDGGSQMCITATLVDGYILSLTPYSHDVFPIPSNLLLLVDKVANLQLLFAESYDGDTEAAKLNALKLITNAVCPDRWENSRVPPTAAELKSTGVLRVRIESASAKINSGGSSDNATDMANEDLKARVWTGVLYAFSIFLGTTFDLRNLLFPSSPIRTVTLSPQPSEYNQLVGAKVPEHVTNFGAVFAERLEAGTQAGL
ncbi:uncharacterized protein P7C70_g5572, partial [Phenoliferia sp. Uapishka_3]